MKKYLKGLFIILITLILIGCGSKNGVEFKNEYEALNGKKNSSGKVHRTVKISSDKLQRFFNLSFFISSIYLTLLP